MNDHDPCLFALNSTRAFGDCVSRYLGVSLSSHEEQIFDDGEHKLRPLVNVRERDVFVIQSLYGDREASVHDKLGRLLFFIGALRDASAARITAVVPYLCYQRAERKTQPRDPVNTRYLAGLFEVVGTDRILAMDVHSVAAYQNAFGCHTDHLEGAVLFAAHFAAMERAEDIVVVSPDAGGMKRAERFGEILGRRLGREVETSFMEKHQRGGVAGGDAAAGELDGKIAVIIDDLVSTGTTLLRTAEECRRLGAGTVFAAATHGIFSSKAGEVLKQEALDRTFVTDTVVPFRLDRDVLETKIEILEAAPLFAESIRRIHEGGSIVELLTPS